MQFEDPSGSTTIRVHE